MSHRALVLVGLVSVVGLSGLGCGSSSSGKQFDGTTYDVQVTAFGKTDSTSVFVDEGNNGELVFAFTYGFYSVAGESNQTGLQAKLSSDALTIPKQPVHVDHSTGPIDGTVTGTGTVSDASLTMTLHVLPTDYTPLDSSGNIAPPGTTVDYTLTGTQQPSN